MQHALISVVTITLNNIEGLKRTIESVLGQDYDHLEFIVVDGGSTDGTPELLRSLDRKNFKWISEPDQGIPDAFNKGTDLSSGDLIIYMNAGDTFVARETISSMVSLIPSGTNLSESIIYGDYHWVDGPEYYLVKNNHEETASIGSINHQSVFIGKSVSRRIRYDTRLFLEMDCDFWMRCLAARIPFIKVDVPIAKFHLGGRSSNPKYVVHCRMTRFFLIALNSGKVFHTGDAVRLCVHVLKTKVVIFLKELIGRKFIRNAKRLLISLKIRRTPKSNLP